MSNSRRTEDRETSNLVAGYSLLPRHSSPCTSGEEETQLPLWLMTMMQSRLEQISVPGRWEPPGGSPPAGCGYIAHRDRTPSSWSMRDALHTELNRNAAVH